jgi:outer membrane protein OmpA-like peptidoglycan-associated protein
MEGPLKKARCITLLIVALVAFLQQAGPALANDQDLLSVTGPAKADRLEFTPLTEGRLTVSVWDTDQNPIPGLGPADFIIQRGKQQATTVSVEPRADLPHGYLVSYRFFKPPSGVLEIDPAELTIEEVTLIDSAPLLNYIYFESGQSAIPAKYMLLQSQAETQAFSEEKLKGGLQKYRQVLNIIGKRLKSNPRATIRLIGCNSDSAQEKGKLELSKSRAEAVRSYLSAIWGVDSSRMTMEGRNLPAIPSPRTSEEGRAENQRVEIHSDFSDILETVETTYVEKVPGSRTVRVLPRIEAEAGIAVWKIKLAGETVEIGRVQGQGQLPPEISFDLTPVGWETLSEQKNITASIEVTDLQGQSFQDPTAISLPVDVVQRDQPALEKKGVTIVERHALILFDYDSAAIKDRNQAIVEKIAGRLRQFPTAVMKIAGYTDNLGPPDYNVSLSEQRARAVSEKIMGLGVGSGYIMTAEGAGPYHPLYDNSLPEGRALNRTVIVTLEYERPI